MMVADLTLAESMDSISAAAGKCYAYFSGRGKCGSGILKIKEIIGIFPVTSIQIRNPKHCL